MNPRSLSRSVSVLIALIIFELLGVVAPAAYGQTESEASYLPIWTVGRSDARTRIVFIWSRNCDECRRSFRARLLPLFAAARKGNGEASFVLIQYPRNKAEAQEVLEAVCDGHEVYTWHVYSYLVWGHTIEQSNRATHLEQYRKPACHDRKKATEATTEFQRVIRDRYRVNKVPLIVINGKSVPPYAAITDGSSR